MNIITHIGCHFTQEDGFIDYNLNGKYVSIIETLFIQLGIDSIYESMHFLNVIDEMGFIKWNAIMKFKLHRDGFVFNLGSRSNILITLTNCSIRSVGSSRNCTSIVGLINSNEDRFTLSLVSQKLDMELMYLHILGLVCPRTGKNIGIVCFNVEDTASLEKTFGKDCASGAHRWHLSIQNKIKHHQQWFTFHLPISVDVKLAHDTWTRFENEVLLPYLTETIGLESKSIHLCEFNKSFTNETVRNHAESFKKIRNKINEFKFNNHGFVGNWQGAKSVMTFGADGLHLSLRIGNHTIKKIILFSLEYSSFLKKNEKYIEINHRGDYEIHDSKFILDHYKNCCEIPFRYDEKNPNRLRITSGIVFLIIC